MSEVISKGVRLSKLSSDIYRDTLLSPIINDNGPFELTKVDGAKFNSIFTNSLDSISWRTASLLANKGYNLLVMRHRPWIINTLIDAKSTNLIYESGEYIESDSYRLNVTNIDIGDLYYIIIKSDNGNVVLWKSTEEYPNSIPSVVKYPNRQVFYGNNMRDYYDTISQKSAELGILIESSEDYKDWEIISDNPFEFIYGYNVPSNDSTSIRLFDSENLLTSDLFTNSDFLDKLPGYVSRIENNRIYISYEDDGYTKEVSTLKEGSDYYIFPRVGDTVLPNSVLYSKLSYSYPDRTKDYSSSLRFESTYDNSDKQYPEYITSNLEGKINIISKELIKLFGVSEPIVNPDVSNYVPNPELNIGDTVNIGSIVYIKDSTSEYSLNTLTNAAYLELPQSSSNKPAYSHGDYFTFNISGNSNGVIIFIDNSIEFDNTEFNSISGTKYYINLKIKVSNGSEVSYADKSHIDINNEVKDILAKASYIVEYNINKNYIYLKRSYKFIILNISNCIKMNYWIIGSYDMECIKLDKYKFMSIYSKYPTSTDSIELVITRNLINFDYNKLVQYNNIISNEIGYDLTISRYSGDTLVDSESFIFDFSEDGEYSYNKITSNIVDIEFHKEYMDIYGKIPLISPGTYNLYRGIYRDVTEEMMLSNIDNLIIDSKDYQAFIDGGIISDEYRALCFNKLKTHENLLMFTVDKTYLDENNLVYDYDKYINSVFSYPFTYLGLYKYPNYVIWLIMGLSNTYTGEISVTGLSSTADISRYRTKLMTVDYDGYRYVMSHNYIHSFINSGNLVFPEVLLVLSRLKSAIYYRIDYQLGESSIINQFYQLLPYVNSISNGVLMNIILNSVKVIDRTCTMDLSIYFNNFKVDPINLLVKVNIN